MGAAPLLGGDAMTQEVHLLPAQLALLHVQNQPILLQPLQNLLEMLKMLVLTAAGNKDVVQITKGEVQSC